MMDFTFRLPSNIHFGNGKVRMLGEGAKKLGSRALIVTGRSSTKASGLLDLSLDLLRQNGVETAVFDKVTSNPLATTAVEGAELAAAERCDLVIALGGGSIIDCAKSIALLAVSEGRPEEYMMGARSALNALPIIAVPTTCGTGSEGNGIAVLSDPVSHDKKAIRGECLIPALSIVDPELMSTLTPRIFASVGFDALCHSMESLISVKRQPVATAIASYAVSVLKDNLVRAYDDIKDSEAVEAVTLCSTLGGMSLYLASAAAPHGMEHSLSGLRNVVHGEGLAALTPVIFERSAPYAPQRFAEVSRLLGGKDESDCAETVRTLTRRLGLTKSLGELGILASDVDWLTENCLRVSAPAMGNHPVRFTPEDVADIYRKAL